MKDIAEDDETAIHASINTLKQTLISFSSFKNLLIEVRNICSIVTKYLYIILDSLMLRGNTE